MEDDIICFKWTNSCRLCLSSEFEIDIFEDTRSIILSNLRVLLDTPVYVGDPMPRKMCFTCIEKLNEFCKFREDCLKVEGDLRKRLQPYNQIDSVQDYFDKCADVGPGSRKMLGMDLNFTSSRKVIPSGVQCHNDSRTIPNKFNWKINNIVTSNQSGSQDLTTQPADGRLSQALGQASFLANQALVPKSDNYMGNSNVAKNANGTNRYNQVNVAGSALNSLSDISGSLEISSIQGGAADLWSAQRDLTFGFPTKVNDELNHMPGSDSNSNAFRIKTEKEVGDSEEMNHVIPKAIKQEDGTVLCSVCLSSFENMEDLNSHVCKLPNTTLCSQCGESFQNSFYFRQHSCYFNSKETLGNVTDNQITNNTLIEDTQSQGSDASMTNRRSSRRLKERLENKPVNFYDQDVDDESLVGSVGIGIDEDFPRNESKTMTPWKCLPCKRYFKYKVDLVHHYASRTCERRGKANHLCEYCSQYFMSYEDLMQHQLVHISVDCSLTCDDLVCCEVCGKEFASDERLQQHMLVHHIAQLTSTCYPCIKCGEVYLREDAFKNHSLMHLGFKPNPSANNSYVKTMQSKSSVPKTRSDLFKADTLDNVTCQYCDKVFTNSVLLVRHMQFIHRMKNININQASSTVINSVSNQPTLSSQADSKPATIRCRLCGTIFDTADKLKKHISTSHTNLTPFSCRKCMSNFQTRTEMLLHMRESCRPKSDTSQPTTVDGAPNPDPTPSSTNGNPSKQSVGQKQPSATPLKPPKPVQKRIGRFKCPVCTKISFSIYNITLHIKAKHPNKPPFPIRLKQPISISSENSGTPAIPNKNNSAPHKRFRCRLCPSRCSSSKSLKQHMKNLHRDREPIVSPVPKNETKAPIPTPVAFTEKKSQNEVKATAKKEPVKEVNDQRKNTCPFCLQIFPNLNYHMKVKHRGERADPSVLSKIGISIEGADRSRVCRYCLKVCVSKTNRILHESIHTVGGKWYKCEHCDKKLFGKALYDHHQKRFHATTSFHCEKCNKIFFKEVLMYKHDCPMDFYPVARKTFKCLKCPRSFDEMKSLKGHITVMHTRNSAAKEGSPDVEMPEVWDEEINKIVCEVDDKFYCTMCDLEFPNIELSSDHQDIHPGGNWYVVKIDNNLFQCTVCGKNFVSHAEGIDHIDFHKSGNTDLEVAPTIVYREPKTTLGMKKNFKCPFCNIAYFTEENLMNHIVRIHPETS